MVSSWLFFLSRDACERVFGRLAFFDLLLNIFRKPFPNDIIVERVDLLVVFRSETLNLLFVSVPKWLMEQGVCQLEKTKDAKEVIEGYFNFSVHDSPLLQVCCPKRRSGPVCPIFAVFVGTIIPGLGNFGFDDFDRS